MKIRTERPPTAKLSSACAAIDAATALYTIEDIAAPAVPEVQEPPPPSVDPAQAAAAAAAKDELARLEQLSSRIERATEAFVGDASRPGAAAAAAAIGACARRSIGEQRDVLARAAEMPAASAPAPRPAPAPAAASAPSRALERPVQSALERYYSHFEMPETDWYFRWRLHDEGAAKLPDAEGRAVHASGIEIDFTLPVPVGTPWRSPSKLGAIAPINGAKLQTGGKPLALAKLWLVAMTTSKSGVSMTVARSHKKAADARIDLAFGQGATATPLGPDGAPTGHAVAQDGPTIGAIAEIYEVLSGPIREMIEDRGSVGQLRYKGEPIERVARPSAMADAIMESISQMIAELRDEYEDDPRKLAALENRLDGVPEPDEPTAPIPPQTLENIPAPIAITRPPTEETIDTPPPPGVAPIRREHSMPVPNPAHRLARGTNSPPVADLVKSARDEAEARMFSQTTVDDFDIDVAWTESESKREQTLPGV